MYKEDNRERKEIFSIQRNIDLNANDNKSKEQGFYKIFKRNAVKISFRTGTAGNLNIDEQLLYSESIKCKF